jgi:hypothetical protein
MVDRAVGVVRRVGNHHSGELVVLDRLRAGGLGGCRRNEEGHDERQTKK